MRSLALFIGGQQRGDAAKRMRTVDSLYPQRFSIHFAGQCQLQPIDDCRTESMGPKIKCPCRALASNTSLHCRQIEWDWTPYAEYFIWRKGALFGLGYHQSLLYAFFQENTVFPFFRIIDDLIFCWNIIKNHKLFILNILFIHRLCLLDKVRRPDE